jgi:flagellar assembly protein FliH
MGARVLDWMQPSESLSARRPSWLAPRPSEPRPRLSMVPGPRLASIAPAPSSARIGEVAFVETADDIDARDEMIRTMGLELEALRSTAAELAATLATARRRMLEASEGELVKLAVVIAARVVGGAITADPTLIAAWARDAIATLPARDGMIVAISPDLAAHVPESAWEMATNGTHRLEIDPALPPATCEVRSGVASIEVSVAARIAAVGEAIGAIS